MKIQIVNESKNPLPTYEVKGSAGMDLRADFSRIDKDFLYKNPDDYKPYQCENFAFIENDGKVTVELPPHKRVLIPTGIHIALPEGYEAQIRPRSGLALKNGIMICNSPGTIDFGYFGEISVILVNSSDDPFIINDGDRIAQIVINKIETAEWEKVDKLIGFDRGGGFGHTGKN